MCSSIITMQHINEQLLIAREFSAVIRNMGIYGFYKSKDKIIEENKAKKKHNHVVFLTKLFSFLDKINVYTENVVNDYYKSDNKSLELVLSNNFSNLLLSYKNDYISKKLKNGAIKTRYIKSSNLNFFDYISDSDSSKITAISKSKFSALIFSSLIHEFGEMTTNLNRIASCFANKIYSDSTEKKEIRFYEILSDEMIDIMIIRHMISYMDPFRSSIIGTTISKSKTKKIAKQVSERYYASYSKNHGDKIAIKLKEFEVILTYIDEYLKNTAIFTENIFKKEVKQKFFSEYSISNIISNTFDFMENNLEYFLKNTEVREKTELNTYTGNQIVVKYRAPIESKCSDIDYCNKIIEVVSETNKFIEKINEKIELDKKALAERNNVKNIIVEGDDIIKYYNSSSYSASYGGTLWNSCMRYPEQKEKIMFYAKNKELVKLYIRLDEDLTKIKGRALIWFDKETKKMYADRLYYTDSSTYNSMVAYLQGLKNCNLVHSNESGIAGHLRSGFPKIKISNLNAALEMPYFDSLSTVLVNKDGLAVATSSAVGKNDISLPIGAININSPELYIEAAKQRTCKICGAVLSSKSNLTELELGAVCNRHIKLMTDNKVIIINSGGLQTEDGTMLKGPVTKDFLSTGTRGKYEFNSKLNFIKMDTSFGELQYRIHEFLFSHNCDVSYRPCIYGATTISDAEKIYYDETCTTMSLQLLKSKLTVVVPKNPTEIEIKAIEQLSIIGPILESNLYNANRKAIIKLAEKNIDKYVAKVMLLSGYTAKELSVSKEAILSTRGRYENEILALQKEIANSSDYTLKTVSSLSMINEELYFSFKYRALLIKLKDLVQE